MNMLETTDPTDIAAIEGAESPSENKNLSQAERWVSGLAGGTLVAYGLTRFAVDGALWAAVGGYLLYRGTSGHCALYERLGISSLSPQPMRFEFERATTIGRPRELVYEWCRELRNLPLAIKALDSVEEVSDRVSHWRVNLPFGRKLEWDAEIVQDVPNERLRWQTLESSDIHETGEAAFLPGTVDRENECDLIVNVTVEPKQLKVRGLMTKLIEIGASAVGRLMLAKDLRNLKSRLEVYEAPVHEKGEGARPSAAAEAPSLH